MPTTYAHYKLGAEMKKKCSGEVKRVIDAYPQLFDIGLHGPDILFYYKPFWHDPVNETGHRLHGESGKQFFSYAKEVLKVHGNDDRYLAYILGVTCHYAMDVTCHGYVAEAMKQTGKSHAEVEMEFDRELLVRDGRNPVSQNLTEHLVPSKENAQVISEFYEGVTPKDVHAALKCMVFLLDFLVAPQWLKRTVILTVLKAVGKQDEMGGLLMSLVKSAKCMKHTERLITLYGQSTVLADNLMKEYLEYLQGNTELQNIYQWNFETKLPK